MILSMSVKYRNGLIILVDSKKAFDTIDWDFNRQWVSRLQKRANSKIQQNGTFSDNIILQRGCRQGDLLSPYLSMLRGEILGEALRRNVNIRLHKPVGHGIEGVKIC